MKNYYEILGVPRDASASEIKAVFRKLATIYHPDNAVFDSAHAAEKFKEINEAHQVLSDPKRRADYDQRVDFPIPKVSHTKLSFGALHIGERKSKRFQVNNIGGPVNNLSFDTSKPDFWFIVDPQWNGAFPVDVDIHADTNELTAGQFYEGWVEINLDGISAKVAIFVNIKETKESSRTFTFKSGENITSPDELPTLCEQYWDEACQYFYEDRFFKSWLIELRRNDLIAKLELFRGEKNKNIGLDKFIRFLDSRIASPLLVIEASKTFFENHISSDYLQEARVRLYNEGPGWCYGTLEVVDATWLSISQRDFVLAPHNKLDLHLKPIPYELIRKGEYSATLKITSNSHNYPYKQIIFKLTTSAY